MVFDVSVAISWILFLALFPITFFWLRRAWRIAINKDFSEVATLLGLLERPFDAHPGFDAYAGFPPDWAAGIEISCSS